MNFHTSFIPFDKTGLFSKLISDYINEEPLVKPFFQYNPDIDGIKEALDSKNAFPVDRKLLVETLKKQNEGHEAHSSVCNNIDLLIKDSAFTITTGHQLNVFTGPIFFIYKIFSTINATERLKQQFPQYDFVPVFWMASEDHDFEEINHIFYNDQKIEWINPEPATGPAGKKKTGSLEEVIEQLYNLTGKTENAIKAVALFKEAYLKNKDLASATRHLVNHFFGQYGLVIIDGNDRELKKSFLNVMKDEVLNQTAFQFVTDTNKKLEASGYKAQANPREINLFYLLNDLRERIIPGDADNFLVHNTSIGFKKEGLLEEMNNFPERFSPNVLLRPLYQESILPNLSYIGGPGEMSYWLQLKELFYHYRIPYPVLLQRNSVMLVSSIVQDKLKKVDIELESFFQGTDELIKEYISEHSEISLKEEEEKMNRLFNGLADHASQVDPTLRASVESELQKALKSLKHIEQKMLKAEKQKNQVILNRITTIKDKLFPSGSPQERKENFLPFYLNWGDVFFAILKENLDPFNKQFIVISETEHVRD
jgi:bacillithiol synthase